MANVKNDWIGYLDRSYIQIKSKLLERVTASNAELTDHSESNVFIIIISMFAAIAEMLGYYIDNIAEESFLATAQRKSSVIRHSKALDYRVKARNPESADLTIVWTVPVVSNFILSSGMQIDSEDGIPYVLLVDQTILAGATSSVVPIAQVSSVNQIGFASTNGQRNQQISLGTTYAHKTMELTIDGIDYDEVDTFAFSGITSKHYMMEIEEDGNAYITLGDGLRGFLPASGLDVDVIYRTTLGPEGKVGFGGFDDSSINLNSVLPGGLAIASANTTQSSSGGSFYEDTETIRTSAINSVRTQNRMVTPRDHQDIIEDVNGVAKAGVRFCCGKTIDIYIVPVGGGVASIMLIEQAQDVADEKKMITTFPVIKPSGETRLVIKAIVTARKRKSIIETKAQVEAALLNFGTVENQEINGAIRLSDIQALIDNLSNVDYVELTSMYTLPYARPIDHVNTLVWVNETKSQSVANANWRIDFSGANFNISKNGLFQASVPVGVQYVADDNSFTLTINAGTYDNGDAWEFTTYPFLKNVQLTDYSIFSIKQSDLYITVNPASTSSNTIC